jgi:putative tricarboxylic transport membrane protein
VPAIPASCPTKAPALPKDMWRDLIGGVAAIVIGGGYLVMALGLRESALADAVGPAGFPKALAFAMLALGLVLCAQALWAARTRRAAALVRPAPAERPLEENIDAEAGDIGVAGLVRAAGMLALGIGYLVVVPYLGYVPSIALLIVAAAVYQGTVLSWRVVAVGIGGAIVYWLVFVWLLGIPLPAGKLVDLF